MAEPYFGILCIKLNYPNLRGLVLILCGTAKEPTPGFKITEIAQLTECLKLARSINNPASLNNTIVQTLKNQNYIQTSQIIKKEKTISPPWTNTFNIL